MRIISGKAKGTKLYTLQGDNTRPTLDRVKESIFNIIQNQIPEATILDLFAGSGAIGLEMVSRGAKKAILCDKSKEAIGIIKKNIEKTHMEEKVELYNIDFKECIEKVSKEKFDIIYIDPPYETNFIEKSLEKIIEKNIIQENGIIILETDDEKRIKKEIEKINVAIIDERKYGRANIIFLSKKT
jgi:16S rRNA (guanine966-N2)-methyltransferase